MSICPCINNPNVGRMVPIVDMMETIYDQKYRRLLTKSDQATVECQLCQQPSSWYGTSMKQTSTQWQVDSLYGAPLPWKEQHII